MGFDTAVFYWIEEHMQSPTLDHWAIRLMLIKAYLLPIVLLLGALILTGKERGWRFLLVAVVAVAISDLICHHFLKPWFARIRPCHVLDFLNPIVQCTQSYSFPSSMAANLFTLATVTACFFRKLILPVFLLAFIGAFTRVYLAVHYPTDILGGAVYGIMIGVLSYRLFLFASAPWGLQPLATKHAGPSENPDNQIELAGGRHPQPSQLEDPP